MVNGRFNDNICGLKFQKEMTTTRPKMTASKLNLESSISLERHHEDGMVIHSFIIIHPLKTVKGKQSPSTSIIHLS
jgi:hypothetical protein